MGAAKGARAMTRPPIPPAHLDPEVLMETTCPVQMLQCQHSETFFWPFFPIDGAMFGSITCMDCGVKLPGQEKLLVDGVLHEYR